MDFQLSHINPYDPIIWFLWPVPKTQNPKALCGLLVLVTWTVAGKKQVRHGIMVHYDIMNVQVNFNISECVFMIYKNIFKKKKHDVYWPINMVIHSDDWWWLMVIKYMILWMISCIQWCLYHQHMNISWRIFVGIFLLQLANDRGNPHQTAPGPWWLARLMWAEWDEQSHRISSTRWAWNFHHGSTGLGDSMSRYGNHIN